MNETVAWLRDRRALTLAAVLIYTFLCAREHDRIQDVVRSLQSALGYGTLQRIWLVLGLGVVATLSAALWRRVRRRPELASLPLYWAGTAAATALSVHFFSVNNNEFVHFFQYGLLAIPVFALSGRFAETIVWVAWLGAFDETWQYAVLHKGWGIPLDFNDIVMNFFGAAMMTTLLVALLPARRNESRRVPFGPAYRFTAAMIGAGLLLAAAGKLAVYEKAAPPGVWIILSRLEPKPFWFFDETWGPKAFHLLHPLEGVAICLTAAAVYSRMDRSWER